GQCRRPVDATLCQQSLAFGLEEADFQATGAGVTNENFHRCLPQEQCPARARVVSILATPQPSAQRSWVTMERWSVAGSRTTAQTPPVQRLLECLHERLPVKRFAYIGRGPRLHGTHAYLEVIASRDDHGR